MNPASLKNLKPWQPGQSGNPGGKTKNIFNQEDVKILFQRLAKFTGPELKALMNDETAPADERAVAKAWVNAINTGNLQDLTSLYAQAVGKLKEVVENNTTLHNGAAEKLKEIPSQTLEDLRIKIASEIEK